MNRLPVLLLPGDTYATRHQGPVLQQLQHPTDADLTVNDAFRPVARFFDRITRPEQLLTALPAAMRTLVDPVETGAVVLSLPQDVQSHAYDFPAELFDERDWVIRRPAPDQAEIAAVAALLAAAKKPLIIAGGGVIYSQATAELERLAAAVGRPGRRDLRRQGRGPAGRVVAARRHRPGGHPGDEHPGPRGRPGPHRRVPADRLRHRLPLDLRQPRRPLRQHQRQRPRRRPARRRRHHRRREARPGRAGRRHAPTYTPSHAWRARTEELTDAWSIERRGALDPDQLFDKSAVPADSDVVTTTDAVLTQGQIIGVLQEHARAGDVIIAAAGGPPGDLQKVWDATGGRTCHLEFGFSCMGYEIPAAIGRADGAPRPATPGSPRSSATAPS